MQRAEQLPGPLSVRFAVLVGIVVVGAGVVVGVLQPTIEAGLVFLIGVAIATPIVYRVARHEFDLFEPLLAVSFSFLVMYVGRPIAMLTAGKANVFKGYVITGQLRETLAIALVAVVAFQVGYLLPWGRLLAARFRPALGSWSTDVTTAYALGLIVLAVLLFSLFLHKAGGFGFLLSFMKGRALSQEAAFRNSSAYLYGAPALIWPASLLLIAVGVAGGRRVHIALGIVAMVALGVFAGSRGSRITLIPLLMAPAVYAYLARNKRPRPATVIIAFYLLFTVGIAYFRDTRTATEHHSKTAELRKVLVDPTYEFRQLLGKGSDNDMFESLAIETLFVPHVVRADPIDFLYRTAAKPIPSEIWHGKPQDADSNLNNIFFPSEQSSASSSTGIVGSWFLAGEWIGVLLGMLALGVLVRVPWEYWRLWPTTSSAQMILAASLTFIPIILRGGVSDTIARLLFGPIPLMIAIKWCRQPVGDDTGDA